VARLDDVVGAILRDLTMAQDVASKHTRMLAVEYANDPLLRHFPVPRTQVSDVEIELRFAPRQLTRTAGSPERTTALAKRAFDHYADLAAHAMLRVASDRFERARSMPTFPASMIDEVRQGLVSPEFESYVVKAISSDLFAARAKIITPPDKLSIDAARDTTIDTAARVVFEHEDLKRFIEANPQFTTDTLGAIRDALKDPLDMLAHDFESSDLRRPEYELEIALDPTELQDAATQTFSTIRIKADVQNYRWVSTPGSEDDQLVEET
jgi:hypothetical protein